MTKKVLGNLKRGLLFIVSAPAGTGKTTLVKMLRKEFSCIVESISYTTRRPRDSEKNGVDYYFVSEETFKEKIKEKELLEYAKVFGNYYGTSKSFVFNEQEKGKHVILTIDTQGALQLKKKISAIYIFIQPPSKEEQKARLSSRRSETEQEMELRLKQTDEEMKAAPFYDYRIINEDLNTAYAVLKSIIIAEEHRTRL